MSAPTAPALCRVRSEEGAARSPPLGWQPSRFLVDRAQAERDRVLVESEKVGSVTRSGVVTAVEDRLITVRWDSGSESVFVPSAGSLRVTGHEPPAGEADRP
jgi:Domain of unknown function (DUF1918)